MPRVPTADGQQVGPGGNQSAYLRAPEASDIAARQLQGFGQAMEGFGQATGQIAGDMKRQADELIVTDALNQTKEKQLALQYGKDTGFASLKGKDAYQFADGRSLADTYGEQLSNTIGDISMGLADERQRQAYLRRANDMLASFKGSAMAHEASEFKTYQLSVADGVQATALRDIELNWRNPDAINAAVERIRAETFRTAGLTGKSAEWQEAQARKLTSNAHKVALMTALDQNDPAYASEYVKRYKDQMDGDDLLSVQGHITKAVDAQLGAGVARQVVGQASRRLVPTDMDRVQQITVQSESGGNPNAVSPVGAKGLYQVMDATAANPGFGIKPSDGTPQDRNRVGQELLGALAKKYGGDAAKMWAGYNAGSRWVDEAIDRAGKAEPGTPQADWFWQLNNDGRSPANRKQTQDYVAKNVALLNAGGGAGPRPVFADIDAALMADPRLAGNPAALKSARQEAKVLFEENEKAVKARDDDTMAEAMRQLQANGGRFSQLPPALRAAVPPKEVDNLMNYGERMAKGEDINNPRAWAQVMDMPPAVLAKMSKTEFLATWGTQLDRAHLEKGYALIDAAQGSSDAKHLEVVALNDRIKRAAVSAGILPKDERAKPNPEQHADFGRFADLVDKKVREFEASNLQGKRKANSEELQGIVDGMVLDKVKIDEWGTDPERPAALIKDDQRKAAYVTVTDTSGAKSNIYVSSIPQDVRTHTAALILRKGGKPTEQAIAQAWVLAGRPISLGYASNVNQIPR